MSDLFGNHIVGFPTRWLIFFFLTSWLNVFLVSDLELNARKNPRQVLRNLDDYLNKKKTVIVAEKSHDSGADNFLSLCDDKK